MLTLVLVHAGPQHVVHGGAHCGLVRIRSTGTDVQRDATAGMGDADLGRGGAWHRAILELRGHVVLPGERHRGE